MNPLKKEKIRSSNECAKDVYERQISILDLYPSLREKVIDEIDLRGLHVQ